MDVFKVWAVNLKILTILTEESWKKARQQETEKGNCSPCLLEEGEKEMRKEKHDSITSILEEKKIIRNNIIILPVSSKG